MFELFDPNGDLQISMGTSLPHWYQPGVTYFVTIRLEDSIPTEVARRWHRCRDDWLRHHGINPRRLDWKAGLHQLARAVQREFHETFSRQYLQYLDRGLGSCVLQQPAIAEEVAASLLHFDRRRYEMGDFVVMPNHLHLIVGLLGETEIRTQCESWKQYTATQINRILSRRGRLWQEDCFDHLVRSPEQYDAIRRYIASNPDDARLQPGTYLHYRRP